MNPSRAALLALLLAAASAAATQSLDWSLSPAEALASSKTTGKPVLVLALVGPQASAFAQDLDRLLTTWPEWTKQVSRQVLPTRLRGTSVAALPPLAHARTSTLALLGPEGWVAQWSQVPTVLELTRSLTSLGLVVAEPYQLAVRAYALADPQGAHRIGRVDGGPLWRESSPTGERTWWEEGPAGLVLLLRDPSTGKRLALPLEGSWSFVSNADQSWSPWWPATALLP